MGNELDDFGNKGLVRGDLIVPILNELPEYDGYESIEL